MFPLQPTSCFFAGLNSLKPNAFTDLPGPYTGNGTLTNEPFAYDNDPTSKCVITMTGVPFGPPSLNQQYSARSGVNYSHTPSSGGPSASSQIVYSALMDATLSFTSVIKSGSNWPQIAIRLDAPLLSNSVLTVDGQAAANAIASMGAPYVVTLPKAIYSTSQNLLSATDVFGLSMNVYLNIDNNLSSGTVAGNFTLNVYDLNVYYT